MICSSEKRFFTSNLLRLGNWTPNCGATQNRGDVVPRPDPVVRAPTCPRGIGARGSARHRKPG
ncbi:hypothetical protein XANMN_06195 [Xanthomonas phaseoli pv. manihotis str. CIO151]|nr:hypothetical protein XANMN_06195 [Xanthomonas phaseoli pv. manihotis str. CIO151]